MKFHNESQKTLVLHRFKRIEGQIRGIAGMIEEERDCREILQQLSAAKSALQGTTLILAEHVIRDCLVVGAVDREKNQGTARDLVEMISRM